MSDFACRWKWNHSRDDVAGLRTRTPDSPGKMVPKEPVSRPSIHFPLGLMDGWTDPETSRSTFLSRGSSTGIPSTLESSIPSIHPFPPRADRRMDGFRPRSPSSIPVRRRWVLRSSRSRSHFPRGRLSPNTRLLDFLAIALLPDGPENPPGCLGPPEITRKTQPDSAQHQAPSVSPPGNSATPDKSARKHPVKWPRLWCCALRTDMTPAIFSKGGMVSDRAAIQAVVLCASLISGSGEAGEIGG